jgi:hypothetical protein
MDATTLDMALAGINRRLLAERYATAERLLQRAQADRNLEALANARVLVALLEAQVTAALLAMANDPSRA